MGGVGDGSPPRNEVDSKMSLPLICKVYHVVWLKNKLAKDIDPYGGTCREGWLSH